MSEENWSRTNVELINAVSKDQERVRPLINRQAFPQNGELGMLALKCVKKFILASYLLAERNEIKDSLAGWDFVKGHFQALLLPKIKFCKLLQTSPPFFFFFPPFLPLSGFLAFEDLTSPSALLWTPLTHP